MTCDVAVVGGGPAGSVAAATLARRGARVALIDGSHPREKPCGGGLTGRALALVADLIEDRALTSVDVTSARFIDGERGRRIDVDLTRRENTLRVFSRRSIDQALFDAASRAGALIVTDRVVGIDVARTHRITTAGGRTIAASFIVGADGTNSMVRRRCASPFRRDQLSMAMGYFAHGITSTEIVLELVDRPDGYIWSFPRPDHLAIGICAQASETTSVALRERIGSWMTMSKIADGARLEFYSWPIPSLSAADYHRLVVGGDGWLTVGDAAGLVDPITREGIFFALKSALFAAEAIAAGGAALHMRYRERLCDDLIPELAMAARLKRHFFEPRFTRLLLDALASSARIRDVMADLAAGTQPYRSLKRRLIGTFELGFAWKWLRGVQRTA